jgi:hypothetical protein
MRLLALVLLGILSTSAAAQAQQLIGSYYALLGPQDHFNSSGARLTDFGAILQQDRANYHRFSRPEEFDDFDPIFGDAAQRARIPSIWTLAPGASSIPAFVTSGETFYVYVEIFGFGTTPQYIVVGSGAG